jgi:hypothetical protein
MPPMHIATYTRRRRSKGGPIFLHEAGGRTDSGRIVLGMLSVYLRSCRVHVALPLLSSVLVQLVRWLPAVEQKCLSTLRDAGGL